MEFKQEQMNKQKLNNQLNLINLFDNKKKTK